MNQIILSTEDNYKEVLEYLQSIKATRILLVCGKSIQNLIINSFFEQLPQNGIEVVRFSDFKPNPEFISAVNGVLAYRSNKCDTVFAVGGGSAIDVAKCIKLYANSDELESALSRPIVPNQIPMIAMPTTAGTGSEATRYAVVYKDGKKVSVTDYSCIPQAVVFDPTALTSLPEYHRKATMLDTLCHSIESYWSVNSTYDSKAFSIEAIHTCLDFLDAYLKNETVGNANMLKSSNLAGKAINITQTTAGHAMSYKLTGMYGIAHGHAAGICVSQLWMHMIENTHACIDSRGENYLKATLQELAEVFGCIDTRESVMKYRELLDCLDLETPIAKEDDYEILSASVNLERLQNHPVLLDTNTINVLYHKILN